MATDFPNSVDSLTNPTAQNKTNSPSHSAQHANANDAIEAIETKLGTGAANQTPVNQKFLVGTGAGASAWSKDVPTGDVVGRTDVQELTNKTIDGASNTILGIGSSAVVSDLVSGLTEEASPAAGDYVLGFNGSSLVKMDLDNLPTPSGAVAALDDIGDVVITAIASGELLKWNGTNWINNTLAEAGIAATTHTHVKTDLTDIADFLLESEVDADIKTLSLPASTTISAFGAQIVDDANAAAVLTTLGITSSVAELNFTDGVTSAIQTQLDGKQPLDADLTTIASLTATTDNFIVAVASSWASRTPSQVRTTLGLVIGTNVQAYSANLDEYAAVNPTTAGLAILDDADASAQRTTLGVAIGTNVQAWDAHLDDLAAITPAQGDIIYFNGTDWTNLAPGTNGQFLKTQGAAANPAWETIPGGGDMLAATYDPATVAEQLVGLTATQTLTNKTLTSPNINEAVALTATATELNILDGATLSTAELNVLDGIPGTLTATELGYVDGVTSAIQTQIDGKQPLDSDLTTIAGLTATTDNFIQAKSSAWASRTPAQVAADLAIEIGKLLYPVGTLLETTTSTNPGTSLGFGTWVSYAAGRVTVAIDAGQTEFDTAAETGGSKEVTLTAAQSGVPAHQHSVGVGAGGSTDNAVRVSGENSSGAGVATATITNGVSANTAADAASAHTNLQPYIVVYRWHRTA